MTATPVTDVWGTFGLPLDNNAVQRVMGAVSVASQGNANVHLLFQSPGGAPGDGVLLYNLFRALPFDLTLYNCGNVLSAAVLAYLGAKRRKVSAYGTFMLHRTTFGPANITAAQFKERAKSLTMDDQRMEAILRAHIDLPSDRWNDLEWNEVWLSADEAVRVGLAHEIGEFIPPPGTKVFNV